MKKILIILLCCLAFYGCKEEVVEEPVEEVIVLDTDESHNSKIKSYNNTITHIYNSYIEMDDDRYGSLFVETYDTNYEPVWRYTWRDLDKTLGSLNAEPIFYDNSMVINVQGIISVHNIATGEFKWELQTDNISQEIIVHENMVYLLGYNDNYVTGVSLDTGEVLLEIIDDSYVDADMIAIDEADMVVYSSQSKEAVRFDFQGQFKNKEVFEKERTSIIKWELVESSDESASAKLVIDGSRRTSWSESVKGYGEKEWLEITKTLPSTVSKMKIINGDQSSEKAFDENAKLKTITLSIGDGKTFTYNFTTFEFGHTDEIKFIRPVLADYILITIIESEPGTTFKNTCVSEIMTE